MLRSSSTTHHNARAAKSGERPLREKEMRQLVSATVHWVCYLSVVLPSTHFYDSLGCCVEDGAVGRDTKWRYYSELASPTY